MPTTLPELSGYSSRYDTGDHGNKNFERVLYRAGRPIQGAELNETQQQEMLRLKGVADALFRDGAIIRDAAIMVNADTGATIVENGAVYLRGAVRGVPPGSFTVPTVGTVAVGVYLSDVVITEDDDPTLRDPNIKAANYNAAGAARLRVDSAWGFEGDGQDGEFYPVYKVVNGVVLSNDAPPQIDGVTLAIAEYDRLSAGGYYVDSGLRLTQLPDLPAGEQVYSLSEGSARVNGRAVRFPHAQRLVYAATPDLQTVTQEPHTAAGGTERVTLNHGPVKAIDQVTITVEKTVTLTHGAVAGAADTLPDSPVVAIVSVTQGGTTYASGASYKLTSDKVDWSPAGPEVATGSQYTVVYRSVAVVTPTGVDDTGFTVTGAVPGTLITTSYRWALPRIDRLCVAQDGSTSWITGVPNQTTPAPPAVPTGLLAIASVRQAWTTSRVTTSDGVRTVPMSDLEAMQRQIFTLFALVATQELRVNATIAEPASKRGIFTDPFLDDDMRDQGVAQDAAIVGGRLMLPIDAAIQNPVGSDRVLLEYELEPVLAQDKRSTSMLVNPYMAFEPIPAVVKLTPEVDFWTEVQTEWTSDSTTRFVQTGHPTDSSHVVSTTTRVSDVVLSSSTTQLEYLRRITIAFRLSGFGPNEVLDEVLFDGIDVTPV